MNSNVWGTHTNIPNSAGYIPTYDDDKWDIGEDGNEIQNANQQSTTPKVKETPHCAYCLLDVPDCLVKCPATGKYFCNGRGRSHHSHIVQHLVKSRNREFQLLDSNKYSKIPLCCYQCQSRNVFQLCFVQSLKQGNFYVFCRDCLNNPSLAPFQFDMQNRYSIITDNSILPWLVRPPTAIEEKQQSFCSKISIADMNLLEETWENDPKASILDLPQIRSRDQIPNTQLTYSNTKTYSYVFRKLIQEEGDYERKVKESKQIRNMSIEWVCSGPSIRIARFQAPGAESIRDLAIGDEIILSTEGFSGKGTVIMISFSEFVEAKFILPRESHEPPTGQMYTIQFLWKGTSYKRMQRSLKEFTKADSTIIHPLIKDIILGKTVRMNREKLIIKSFAVPELPVLNDSQKEAIQYSIEHPFTLIQGPPGTGKTTTIAALTYQFLQLQKKPLLVCGPSNITVEHLTRSIGQTGVRVVRIQSWSLDGTPSTVDQLNAFSIALQLGTPKSRMLLELHQKRMVEPLFGSEKAKYESLREELEKEVARSVDVVTCTCDTAGSRRLKDLKFPVVIIDESTQTVEPKLLIPILHGCKQVVLVGDHMQLGPNISSPKALRAGLSVSMVQRLVQLGMKPVRLLKQYRMHPSLAEFPSNYFYGGILQNGVSAHDRTPLRPCFPFPQPNIPMFFYNSNGEEEQSDNGASYINRLEAYLVSQIISKLCHAGVDPNQIGVITPYAGQRFYLKQFLSTAGDLPMELYSYIEVASVDSFQGGERDYIIFSCVRNNKSTIGFLKDPRRLNVALTRARKGLMIIGSAKCLSMDISWYALIKHFQERQVLVEGNDINRLKPSPIVLQQPVIRQKSHTDGVPTATTGRNMVSAFSEIISYELSDDDDYFGK
ncbi:regulator of nonsense transcripts 1 [Histomonas meleagridis]|uniref:regulator of nonsense transcripts 1-like n=1 Tax=Histomonas meleagridis TaxID=135588 RepID=UPI00355A6D37|nr:regulator of nonsense transcripts 1 [Histomonas meleagridis]KAH0803232.1 regulator of nonsense transcripts 1-like [Histomonas meleagridis]